MENQVSSPLQDAQTSSHEGKLFQYREKMKLEQNLPMAFLGGTLAAIIGALIWAVVTITTNYQIGYMAVGVGFLVGYSVRFFGKGFEPIFGIVGAVLALVGCLLGNFLSILGFVANSEGFSYIDTLLYFDYTVAPAVMMETFSPMDLLFYGIAIYEGYKFSFRQLDEQDVVAHATKY